MRRSMLFMLFVCSMGLGALAQKVTVSGNVTDSSGNPIAGASVREKGTKNGVSANSKGNFTINVSPEGILTISAVGFKLAEIKSLEGANVILKEDSKNLSEVVVVGYSTSTKEAFSGSAKVVSADRLNNKNISNVSQALAGEVAGVRVINTSGQPGTVATIRIRGLGSVNGNRSPLYVIDGVPFYTAEDHDTRLATGSGTSVNSTVNPLNGINPEDIASTTVLKDAVATAIYGSRGANGVIVITTKSGAGRKSFIDVDGKIGTNVSLLPRYEVLTSPEEYITLSWEAMYNQGVKAGNANPTKYANTTLFSNDGIRKNNNIWNVATGADMIDSATRTIKPGVTRKYDPERWSDYAFQTSNRTEASIRMGGGDKKTNFYSSFGYLKDIGYSIKSDFQRLTGRVNLSHEVKPWLTSNINLNYSNTTQNNNGQASNSNSIFWFVDNIPPFYPLFLRDNDGAKVPDPIFGGYQYDYGATGRKFGSLTNAIAEATYNTIRHNRNDISGSASLTLKFSKNFSFDNKLGLQYYNNARVNRNNKFYGSAASQNGAINQDKDELMNLTLQNKLRYTKRFGEHNLEVLAAHEATKYTLSFSGASGFNLIDNYSLEISNATVKNPTAYSGTDRNRLESYFGQVNYDFNSTYYLSGTLRRDGSSRFTKGNAWGTFGSVGAGWIISKMNFMRDVKFVDFLKLRASYGILGDQSGLGYYPGYSRVNISNLNDNTSLGIPVPGNPALTWEKSSMSQIGVEFGLGNFVTGTVEYYIKNTKDLIFDRRVGPSNGYALITVNDGKLRNQGIEFDLTFHLVKKKSLFLDFSINGEHFTNKVTAMPIDPVTGKNKTIDVQSLYAWTKGHSIYDFYVRNFAGVDSADGSSTWTVYYDDANNSKTFQSGEQVSDLETFYANNPEKRNKLLVGTTKLYSQATQYYNGKSAVPKIRGAFNLNGGFKGIELDIQMLYSVGGYAYDALYAGLMSNGLIGGNNWSTDVRSRWQKKGDITSVPKLSNNADANVSSTSSRFIEKANYLVLNNVRLGYSLPKSSLDKIGGIQQASVWISGDNLWLKSARNGFNPSVSESGASSTYAYSPLSAVTFGLSFKF